MNTFEPYRLVLVTLCLRRGVVMAFSHNSLWMAGYAYLYNTTPIFTPIRLSVSRPIARLTLFVPQNLSTFSASCCFSCCFSCIVLPPSPSPSVSSSSPSSSGSSSASSSPSTLPPNSAASSSSCIPQDSSGCGSHIHP
jgi:hypothetical protein